MNHYTLGSVEASEQLIEDLYISLRNKVNDWSKITQQTPQARMGYVGQHLVSVVTGFPGGKSGARGYDLVMGDGKYGEIKTCYRVDQLGMCGNCGAVVSSLEKTCSKCGSTNIVRKDDSKWLIGIQHDQEFSEILDPFRYYFVLFEFEDINDVQNNNIIASIWEVNPRTKGFGYCMMDYYLNIRSKSKSKAPFNMWPYSFKFALTQPRLIYRSTIADTGEIQTSVFPSFQNTYIDDIQSLSSYSRANTISRETAFNVWQRFEPKASPYGKSKSEILKAIDFVRITKGISNAELCDVFSDAIYLPVLLPYKDVIPKKITQFYPNLQ